MKSRVHEYDNYRSFLRDRLGIAAARGARGGQRRGELMSLARAAGVHPSVVSQVFSGARELTPEQAAAVSDYLGLKGSDAEAFLLLVQRERAGTPRLREWITGQLSALRERELQLGNRVSAQKVLSEDERALFYSSWIYSAVRVFSSIPGHQNPEALAVRLGLPLPKLREVLDFLVGHGLCVRGPTGISPGPLSTHLAADSPWVWRHHANWRVKAMDRHPKMGLRDELAFSSPMSLSRADAAQVREILAQAIEKACERVDGSQPEVAYCLGIDWLQI